MKFLEKNRTVIFKQRIARHLAVREDLAWEYQDGSVLFTNKARKQFVCVGCKAITVVPTTSRSRILSR